MPSLRPVLVALCLGAAPALTSPVVAQTATAAPAALRLSRLFGDGVVLQRGAPIHVWGWARPGAKVQVRMPERGDSERATADASGAWKVALPAAPAGGPYTLVVDAGEESLTVHDVLVGDVWVASGQSNMEFAVSRGNDAAREIAAAHDSGIREFKIPTGWSYTPASDVAGGRWVPADPQHVGDMSAVAYFFARDLRKSTGVPIGIVNTTWGGSAIEAWISRPAQRLTDSAWRAIEARERGWAKAMQDTLEAHVGSPLPTVDSGLVNGRAVWAEASYSDSAWKSSPVPGAWEHSGYPGLDGVAWYRTTVTLTDDQARRGVRLSLGTVDDADQTWVNGVPVGQTSGYNVPRHYDVPASALHAGPNVIAVRVLDGGGDGGFTSPAESLYVDVGDISIMLPPTWKFRVAQVALGTDGQHVNKIPTVLYNQMVAPILPMPIKGVIWYQGESNADRDEQAKAYRAQFAQLITSWRRAWGGGRGDFPFLWVQLPEFGAIDSTPPSTAAWATLRESQAAALALPKTGQAVAIGLGNPNDIHPTNKQDVGHRLALVARRVAYGENVVANPPAPRGHTVANGRMTVRFDQPVAAAPNARADSLPGFAVAGADRRWVWARARLDGDRVVVWSDAVKTPAAVRYLWGNSPRAIALVGRTGLPVAPFRTDAW